jgi:hypothetical protein
VTHNPRTESRIMAAIVTVTLVGCLCFGYLGVARCFHLAPYENSVSGKVVEKHVTVFGGKPARVEYFLSVESRDRTVHTIGVTREIYGEIEPGWIVESQRGHFEARSPQGDRRVFTLISY